MNSPFTDHRAPRIAAGASAHHANPSSEIGPQEIGTKAIGIVEKAPVIALMRGDRRILRPRNRLRRICKTVQLV